MNDMHSRSPDELERDIERTRTDIDRTLSALQNSVSPAAVLDRTLRSTREGGGQFAASIGRTVRDNPVPLALLGVSLAWLMISSRDSGEGEPTTAPQTYEPVREDPNRPSAVYTTPPPNGVRAICRRIRELRSIVR